MIRVLHIVLGLQVGGLEKFVLNLIDNYQRNVHSYVICLEEKGELGKQYPDLHIYELFKGAGFSWRALLHLVSLILKLKIDIIHTHNPGPHLYGGIAGFITRRSVIHTKHGRNYPQDKRKVLLNQISSRLTKKIVAVSKDAASVCTEIERIPGSKVTTILNGIDTKLFTPGRKFSTTDRKVRIGIVARLSAEKDHDNLLMATKELSVMTEKFHLDIIGDGQLRNRLENLRNELGLSDYVSFLGVSHDVATLLRELDIFVLSSTTEGISLTLLEAMASGLPVVATNVGGNPEVVVDELTGILVPAKNPSEMALAIMKLIENQQLRLEMGMKGRQRAIKHFSIKETARQYEELYASCIG